MKIPAFIILMFLSGCVSQNCDEIYTISGQVLDGTTGNVYANQPLEISVSKLGMLNGGYEILTTGKTDAEGKFNLSYECSSIEDGKVKIVSDFFIFEDLPVNQNINRNFYISSKGKIRVILKTDKPLEENNDTLFITFALPNTGRNYVIDTITNIINGEYKTFHVPIPSLTIYYGRNAKEFPYDPTMQRFKSHLIKGAGYKISGDPIIDEVTLEY